MQKLVFACIVPNACREWSFQLPSHKLFALPNAVRSLAVVDVEGTTSTCFQYSLAVETHCQIFCSGASSTADKAGPVMPRLWHLHSHAIAIDRCQRSHGRVNPSVFCDKRGTECAEKTENKDCGARGPFVVLKSMGCPHRNLQPTLAPKNKATLNQVNK